jgi:peptide/nickel transport system ATP-binding protein
MSLLSVDDLHVHFRLEQGALAAVSGVGFDLERGETLGLVGESGCGKSTAAYACMGLLPGSALIPQGSIRFDGQELVGAKDKVLQSLRGRRLAMVFQDAMTALNPYLTVEAQLTGPMRRHLGVDRTEARKRAIALLERVGIPDPEQRMKRHPHEFSGGQRQRLLISLALSCEPELLICDEPTTALDVTIQAQVLDLLKDLQQERELALLFISHDLGVVSQLCERLIVLYAGRMAESGPTADVPASLHQGPARIGAGSQR